MLLELCKGVDGTDPETRAALNKALKTATASAAVYSRVLPHHTLLLPPGSLPITFKGAVQRAKAEKQFSSELDALQAGKTEGMTTLAEPEGEDEDEGYDSTAFASSKKGGAKKERNYEFLTGARFLACMWVVIVHHTDLSYLHSDNKEDAVADGAMRRAGIAMIFFMMVSGFGCHLSNAKVDVIAKGWKGYGRFLFERLDRIVLTLWLGFLILFLIQPWNNPTHYKFSDPEYIAEFFLCTLTFNGINSLAVDTQLCLGDGWFIGALVPLFAAYPLFARLIRAIDRKAGGWGLSAFCLVLWCIYFVPILIVTLNAFNAGIPFESGILGIRGLQRFVGFHAVDFFIGAAMAHLSMKHAKLMDAAPGAKTLLPMCQDGEKKRSGLYYARAVAADLTVASIMVYAFTIFSSNVCKDAGHEGMATCKDPNVQQLADSHAFVPLVALFLYGASAGGGAGCFARIFEFAGLVAFGDYSLDVFVLSAPVAVFLMALKFDMEGMDFMNIEGFVIYVTLLWLFSVASARLLMAPLSATLRRCLLDGEGCGACGCCKPRSTEVVAKTV